MNSISMSDAALKPYDWQEADIRRIVKSVTPKAGALVVSAPGAGKTIVGVEVARRLKPKTILVIAPQGTHKGAWGRTFTRQMGPEFEPRRVDGTAKGKLALASLRWGDAGVFIMTPQWLARQDFWSAIEPDMVIFDEIHMAGNYGIATQKRLHELHSPIRLGLSGTPLRNKFENAWSLVRWIEPALMPLNFYLWRIRECETEYDPFAPQNRRVVGELEPGKLMNSLGCYVAHMQREKCCRFHPKGFLAGLKAPIRIERDVAMTPRQRKFYQEMEGHLVSSLSEPNEEGVVPVRAELPVVARGMLRFCANGLPSVDPETEKLFFEVDCESPKIDQMLLDMEGLDSEKFLILTHSRRFIAPLMHRLEKAGYTAFEWSGAVTQKRRDKALTEFRTGKLEVIVGQIGAIGTGTDGIQDVCNNVLWISLDDDPTSNTQGRGRLDRLGQRTQVTEIEYRSEGTIDEGIYSKQMLDMLRLGQSLKRAA